MWRQQVSGGLLIDNVLVLQDPSWLIEQLRRLGLQGMGAGASAGRVESRELILASFDIAGIAEYIKSGPVRIAFCKTAGCGRGRCLPAYPECWHLPDLPSANAGRAKHIVCMCGAGISVAAGPLAAVLADAQCQSRLLLVCPDC